jgi:hypothetical protein
MAEFSSFFFLQENLENIQRSSFGTHTCRPNTKTHKGPTCVKLTKSWNLSSLKQKLPQKIFYNFYVVLLNSSLGNCDFLLFDHWVKLSSRKHVRAYRADPRKTRPLKHLFRSAARSTVNPHDL